MSIANTFAHNWVEVHFHFNIIAELGKGSKTIFTESVTFSGVIIKKNIHSVQTIISSLDLKKEIKSNTVFLDHINCISTKLLWACETGEHCSLLSVCVNYETRQQNLVHRPPPHFASSIVVYLLRDSKSGERGEHVRAIFCPCCANFWSVYAHRMCIGAYFWLQLC